MYLVVVCPCIASHFQDALIQAQNHRHHPHHHHKPLSPSQYSQLSQHTSTINIGATFRSIDVNERMWEVSMLIQEYTLALLTTRPIMLSRRYEYYVVPNIQALSSVLVISHINEDGGDQHASY